MWETCFSMREELSCVDDVKMGLLRFYSMIGRAFPSNGASKILLDATSDSGLV